VRAGVCACVRVCVRAGVCVCVCYPEIFEENLPFLELQQKKNCKVHNCLHYLSHNY
jgi:hypothetical protein